MARSCGRLLLAAVFALLSCALCAAEAAPRRVLILYSYYRHLPWNAKIISGLDEVVDALPLQDRPFIFEEYLDTSRVGDVRDPDAWARYLSEKYRNTTFDAVVSESQQSVEYLVSRPELFPGAARYLFNFASTTRFPPQQRSEYRFPLTTDFEKSILAIHEILPEVTRVVVIDDRTVLGRARREQVESIIPRLGSRFFLEIWDDFTLPELLLRVSRLQKNTAVFYLPVMMDRNGATLVPYSVATRISAASPVPVLTHFDSLLGSGVLGGYLISGSRLGSLIGRIAVKGNLALPDSREAYTAAMMGYYFDARAISHWKIRSGNIPQGATILYREESFFERYWMPLFLVILAFSLETLLLVSLVRISRQRRIALSLLSHEREGLAEKVRLRTADLAKANDELVAEVAERKQAELREQKIAREKSILLKELQHRMKNSMAIIASLVKLEALQIENPESLAVLSKLELRITALATLYSILFDSGEVEAVPLDEYLDKVVSAVAESTGSDLSGITIVRDLAPCVLDLKQAITLGLIVNELVTDSLKYAFPGGRPGRISVSLRADEGGFELGVCDDGVGLPPHFKADENKGFGLNLVKLLAEQLQANFSVGLEGGACFRLNIPRDSLLT